MNFVRSVSSAAVWALVAAAGAALAGCSPLPGASVDPMYLKIGDVSARPASQVAAVPAPAAPVGARMWSGRYHDSRGEGELTFALTRDDRGLSGTWRLRTGGGGSLTAVAERDTRRFRLVMESSSAGCPGRFEGWAEMETARLTGAYHGSDCEGPVSDGRFDLTPNPPGGNP